jgi:hypothetical protein
MSGEAKSFCSGGDCVEVVYLDGVAHIIDTKDPASGDFSVSGEKFDTLRRDAKAAASMVAAVAVVESVMLDSAGRNIARDIYDPAELHAFAAEIRNGGFDDMQDGVPVLARSEPYQAEYGTAALNAA